MPVTRLYPNATTGNDFTLNGAATAHQALSDETDSTYLSSQFSQFETGKTAWGVGPAITQLPTGVGFVNNVVVNVRGNRDSGALNIGAGEYNTVEVSGALTTTPTTFSSVPVNLGSTPAAINALGWTAQITWVSTDGVVGVINGLSFDVDWNPAITGFKGMLLSAMILGVLGPLSGVQMAEMPALERELWRRARTRLVAGERERAWRELREDRRARYFVLGSDATRPRQIEFGRKRYL